MWLIGLGGEARIFEDMIVPDPFGSVVIPRLQMGTNERPTVCVKSELLRSDADIYNPGSTVVAGTRVPARVRRASGDSRPVRPPLHSMVQPSRLQFLGLNIGPLGIWYSGFHPGGDNLG